MHDVARDRADPLRRGLAYLLEASMQARNGRTEDALDTLDRALADGCRYRAEWLEGRAELVPLRGDARFRELVSRANDRYNEDAAAARPHLTFALPDEEPDAFGHPLLIALHGNESNARVTAPFWTTMADAGWVVVVPQSSAIGMSPDAYIWDDRAQTASELGAHVETAKRTAQIDVGRIVLAGFGVGGTQAIALPLAGQVRVRGIVPVAPWLPDISELAALVERGAGRMLRSFFVVGDRDPAAGGARALADLFAARGMRTRLDLREGLGHDYPADMHETLARALEFVTTP